MAKFTPNERGDLGPAPEVKPVYVPSDKERIAAKAAKQSTEKPVAPKKVTSKEELSKKLKKRAARRKVPTVRRGEGGRIESTRTPVIPQTEEKSREIVTRRTVARVSTPRTKKTRTGKKLDKVTGKVVTPTVRRGESGKIEAVPQEERANITRLPAASQELMQPASRTFTPQPQGTLSRGGQRTERGFVAPYKLVKAGVDAALGHLGKMKETLGTPEFDTHHQNFNAVHENLSKIDPHGLGISLGRLKHETIHGKNPRILDSLHNLVQDRLDEGKRAHEKNVALAQAGRARKAGN